jgi:hypothetical protein
MVKGVAYPFGNTSPERVVAIEKAESPDPATPARLAETSPMIKGVAYPFGNTSPERIFSFEQIELLSQPSRAEVIETSKPVRAQAIQLASQNTEEQIRDDIAEVESAIKSYQGKLVGLTQEDPSYPKYTDRLDGLKKELANLKAELDESGSQVEAAQVILPVSSVLSFEGNISKTPQVSGEKCVELAGLPFSTIQKGGVSPAEVKATKNMTGDASEYEATSPIQPRNLELEFQRVTLKHIEPSTTHMQTVEPAVVLQKVILKPTKLEEKPAVVEESTVKKPSKIAEVATLKGYLESPSGINMAERRKLVTATLKSLEAERKRLRTLIMKEGSYNKNLQDQVKNLGDWIEELKGGASFTALPEEARRFVPYEIVQSNQVVTVVPEEVVVTPEPVLAVLETSVHGELGEEAAIIEKAGILSHPLDQVAIKKVAGIQQVNANEIKELATVETKELSSLLHSFGMSYSPWIPAFARMTPLGVLSGANFAKTLPQVKADPVLAQVEPTQETSMALVSYQSGSTFGRILEKTAEVIPSTLLRGASVVARQVMGAFGFTAPKPVLMLTSSSDSASTESTADALADAEVIEPKRDLTVFITDKRIMNEDNTPARVRYVDKKNVFLNFIPIAGASDAVLKGLFEEEVSSLGVHFKGLNPKNLTIDMSYLDPRIGRVLYDFISESYPGLKVSGFIPSAASEGFMEEDDFTDAGTAYRKTPEKVSSGGQSQGAVLDEDDDYSDAGTSYRKTPEKDSSVRVSLGSVFAEEEDDYSDAGTAYRKTPEKDNQVVDQAVLDDDDDFTDAGTGYRKTPQKEEEDDFTDAGTAYRKTPEQDNKVVAQAVLEDDDDFTDAGTAYRKTPQKEEEDDFTDAGTAYRKTPESQTKQRGAVLAAKENLLAQAVRNSIEEANDSFGSKKKGSIKADKTRENLLMTPASSKKRTPASFGKNQQRPRRNISKQISEDFE